MSWQDTNKTLDIRSKENDIVSHYGLNTTKKKEKKHYIYCVCAIFKAYVQYHMSNI